MYAPQILVKMVAAASAESTHTVAPVPVGSLVTIAKVGASL